MPIFDFICNGCGKKFETLVMGSTKPSCPYCQSDDLTKQVSAFAFRSSGSSSSESGSSSSGSGCKSCAGGTCSTCH